MVAPFSFIDSCCNWDYNTQSSDWDNKDFLYVLTLPMEGCKTVFIKTLYSYSFIY